MRKKQKPYRIIGAYDSETTNYMLPGRERVAFPILHQLGILKDPEKSLCDITPDNVESMLDIRLFRHTWELYAYLDTLLVELDYVPVIACHNLGFDMYGLAEWLSGHSVKVLAKSARKPITFTILNDDGEPLLVLWDTLVFSQKPLSMMGHECCYEKLSGEWDYTLVRTPETPLSDNEISYATHDVYALVAWLGYWLRMNPDIDGTALACRIVTKMGVIRYRRSARFDGLRAAGAKYNAGRFWSYMNRTQQPKTDDELFTMHASTRGGFTFCASKWASVPIDGANVVIGYDATSQHPAQMVSHFYPVDFHKAEPRALDMAFKIISAKSVDDVLKRFDRPFPVAFNACFEFENLRPKAGSPFGLEGIYPLAAARFSRRTIDNLDNQDSDMFKDTFFDLGYKDAAEQPVYLFGKLVSAKSARLYITELTAWEIAQSYDFDSVRAVSGYLTMRFVRPCDMAVISVMQFYDAKAKFKKAMREYEQTNTITNAGELINVGISSVIVEDMRNGELAEDDLQFVYLGLKADLNGLFGIEATNEYRKDTILASTGIAYTGNDGICNAPKNPKAWYQFGQRIVGWSRIAQTLVMKLCYPYCKGIVNGDTDSVKFVISKRNRKRVIENIDNALKRYASSIDKAKSNVCKRVRSGYPAQYSSLDGIGHYVFEFEASNFCASWNKAYLISDGNSCDFTLAGIPTRNSSRNIDLNRIAEQLLDCGWSFAKICNDLLGYNMTISNDVTGLNVRLLPQWGDRFTHRITDYQGRTANVSEPRALALFPMSKTINDTNVADNAANLTAALFNNPNVVYEPRMLYYHDNKPLIIETKAMHNA